MKILLVLVGAQLVVSQYGPLPGRKTARPPPDSVNEIIPADYPQGHGLNGLSPGVNPLNKATNFWWSGPNSPFKPGSSGGNHPVPNQPGDRPASGCPPGGCGAPPPCADGQKGCTPSQLPGHLQPGSNPFLGQGYGPRPGSRPPSGSGTPPQSSSQTTNQPIDIGSNPFFSGLPQKPQTPADSCNSQEVFCVPSQTCYNGVINDNDPNLQYKYRKGPCASGYVCCRAASQPGSQSPGSQPGSFFPGNQPGSQNPSTQPGNQPGAQFPGNRPQPGAQFPGNRPQPGAQFPGNQPQPGVQFPGNQPQPGAQFPGNQQKPSSQYPSSQPGAQFPSTQTQPGSQYPGNQPQQGSHFPGSQGSHFPSNQPQQGSYFPGTQTGTHFPSNQPQHGSQSPSTQNPNNQQGSQFPGNRPQPGSQYPSNQPRPGNQYPGAYPGSQPQAQPGSQFPATQTGSQFPGSQPGAQFPGGRPSYVTESPVNKYTGPLNTEVPPGCAAALKCVSEVYCTIEGVMSDTPVQLTREQLNNRVPLTDCLDPQSGSIGKCCRDPNYKDPWPAGMMMAKGQSPFDDGLYKGDANTPFDDGQYRPEHQGPAQQPGFQQQPTSLPGRTIKKPLGVFNMNVTPFPAIAKPQPGQTHSQVFPQNEDKIASNPGVQPGVGGQFVPGIPQQPGQYAGATPGQFGGQGQQHIPSPHGPAGHVSPASQPIGTSIPSAQYPQGSYSPQPASPNPVLIGQPGQSPTPGQFPSQPGSVGGYPVSQPGPTSIPQGGPAQPQPNVPYGSSPAQRPFPPPFPGGQKGSQPSPTSPQAGSSQPQPGSVPAEKQFPPPFPGSVPLTPHHTSPQQPQSPQVVPGQECGIRRPPYTDNVNVDTAEGEFPWQAIVLSSSNRSALCSGAIISDNAILTSAHCLEGFQAKDLQVKVGSWKLNEPGKTQISNVAAIVPHPSYDAGSLAKDQAVLALEQPLVFDQNVDKVCLPPADNEHYSQDGKTCYVTGYGRPNLQGGLPGTVLHKVEINLIPNNQCENTLRQTYLGKFFILNEGFTCAQPKYGDFCKVDVGSPLVCDRGDGHYELAGVYSWDTQCSSQAPAVLTECDSRWTQQVLNTPVDTLKAQQNVPRFETSRPEDIDQKPGFALGYGK